MTRLLLHRDGSQSTNSDVQERSLFSVSYLELLTPNMHFLGPLAFLLPPPAPHDAIVLDQIQPPGLEVGVAPTLLSPNHTGGH